MTWLEHHRRSEKAAADAEAADRAGDRRRAESLYAKAAKHELEALRSVDPSKARTVGATVVSAVSLFFKAGQLGQAQDLAIEWLGSKRVPSFGESQLRSILQSVWSELARARAGLRFAPGEVVVAVRGGEVVEGGAPLDLIVGKVQTVQAMFYRAAESLAGLPHRKRGLPPQDIQDSCRPWLFQTAPGSYQFAVAVQEPRQKPLFERSAGTPVEIADHFFQVLRAAVEDPESGLKELVPDEEYRATFLKLSRNLAPQGKVFDELDVHLGRHPSVRLVPSTRKAIGRALTKPAAEDEVVLQRESLRGVLRAVHLDKDWLEVTVDGEHKRVVGVGDQVDDVIGPMVNKSVVVQVLRDPVSGKRTFQDIEPDE